MDIQNNKGNITSFWYLLLVILNWVFHAQLRRKFIMRYPLFFVTILSGLLLVISCSKDDVQVVSPSTPPKLVVSPDTLMIADLQLADTFLISADAPGSIDWQVTNTPSWLTVQPSSGTVGQTITPIGVAADTAGLGVGTYSGRIEIISTGGEGIVTTFLNVLAHPRMSSNLMQLDFPDSVDLLNFTVTNSGTGMLSWSLQTADPWLMLTPTSGFLTTGNSTTVTATVDRSGLAIGGYSNQITSSSNSETGELNMPVALSVPAITILSASPNSILIDYFTTTQELVIANLGNSSMNWSVTTTDTIVQLIPSSGSLAAGDSQSITITPIRAGLASATHHTSIEITEVSGQADTIPLALNHFVESKWLLDHNVLDAEFDTVRNLIITVAESPNYLFILDPFNRIVDSVPLPKAPLCVGLRPDGAYAVTGHDGFFSYVDLLAKSVVQTYTVTTEAADIVLPSNGWVYVMPVRDQWERLRCVELATGYEADHKGFSIRADSRMKLHPSGDYIYAADRGLSPSDFEKYDIRTDTAIYMYDSPYHGDFSFAGDVWIAEGGARLFARSGNTFKSSTIKAEDMTYTGALTAATFFKWIDHSSEAGRIATLSGSPTDSLLRVYDANFLSLKGNLELSPFLVPDGGEGGTLYQSNGKFVFFDGAGLTYVVLVQAKLGSGLFYDWAVMTLVVADGP